MKKGITIGMDLGDKKHQVCMLDKTGKIMAEEEIAGNCAAVAKFFKRYRGAVYSTHQSPDDSRARLRRRRAWTYWSGTRGN